MSSLGKDLAAIRKNKDLSVEEVQKTTKIPVSILQSIEDDSIFEQLSNNTTYTRNYVRSYARALGVDERKIIRALNQMETSTYKGSLSEKTSDSEDTTVTGEQDDVDTTKKKKEPTKKKSSQKEVHSPTPPSQIAPKDWDWVQVGQKTNTSSANSPGRKGVLVFILLILFIIGGFLIYFYFYADSGVTDNINIPGTDVVKQPEKPSDSLREALTNKQNKPAMDQSISTETGSLPDTLTISIYADGGKLEPVRVFTDILGKRNPYWVSQGDTIRFNFVNTVRIRAANQYNRVKVVFNGHIIPKLYQNYYDKKLDLVELNRSVFENHPSWRKPAR